MSAEILNPKKLTRNKLLAHLYQSLAGQAQTRIIFLVYFFRKILRVSANKVTLISH